MPHDVETEAAAAALAAPLTGVLTNTPSLASAFAAMPALFGGSTAFLFNVVEGRPGLVGCDEAMALQQAYADGKWKSADVLTAIARTLPQDRVFFSQDFLPEQQVMDSPYFQEFLKPRDMFWGAGWLFDLHDERWAFAFCRSYEQGPFGPSDRAVLDSAAPRLSAIVRQLTYISAQRAVGVRAALASRRRAYAMLDHCGLVCEVSPPASDLLDKELQVQNGRLIAADPEANERLQDLANRARMGRVAAEQAGIPAPEEFIIPRASGRPPIIATPTVVRPSPADALPGAQIVLLLADLSRRPQPHAAPLRQLFKLTPREIEIAQLVAAGEDADSIGATLGLKPAYVRQVIKSLFAKTGAHRIGELVALLARMPDDG